MEFFPADDTDGMIQAGVVRFDSGDLATWGVRTVNEVTGLAGAVDEADRRKQRVHGAALHGRGAHQREQRPVHAVVG